MDEATKVNQAAVEVIQAEAAVEGISLPLPPFSPRKSHVNTPYYQPCLSNPRTDKE
ncbi:MAG: hypothetical protein WAM42_20000 [Candidatus Nitrosopolaris sp.]